MSRPRVRFDCVKAPTIGVRTPARRSGIYNVNRNDYTGKSMVRISSSTHRSENGRTGGKVLDMSGFDKAKGKAEELKGDAKQKVGDATDNQSLQAEGVADQASGKAKQAAADIKQAGEDITR